MRIKPFRALRPPVELADHVAAPPYDTVDTEEARAITNANPQSFLHVSRPEVDLPPGSDPHSEAAYARAVENFRAFREKKWLVRDADPALFVYRMKSEHHVQHGVLACCHVDDYVRNLIRKHELTRIDKENDRVRHIEVSDANTGPVLLTYRESVEVDRHVASVVKSPPLYDIRFSEGVTHSVWRVPDSAVLVKAFEAVPTFYIADGHHRAAAAARVAADRRARHPGHTGSEEYNWFMSLLFPANQLRILPYNRCVRDLCGKTEHQFLAEVGKAFMVGETVRPEPPASAHASMYLAGKWYGLRWHCCEGPDPVKALDVSVLQSRLLGPILCVRDPRTDPRVEFVGGIRGVGELTRRVDSGRAAVAFLMHPVTPAQMMAVADTGSTMPPKSTWFEPKPKSGLIIHPLD